MNNTAADRAPSTFKLMLLSITASILFLFCMELGARIFLTVKTRDAKFLKKTGEQCAQKLSSCFVDAVNGLDFKKKVLHPGRK